MKTEEVTTATGQTVAEAAPRLGSGDFRSYPGHKSTRGGSAPWKRRRPPTSPSRRCGCSAPWKRRPFQHVAPLTSEEAAPRLGSGDDELLDRDAAKQGSGVDVSRAGCPVVKAVQRPGSCDINQEQPPPLRSACRKGSAAPWKLQLQGLWLDRMHPHGSQGPCSALEAATPIRGRTSSTWMSHKGSAAPSKLRLAAAVLAQGQCSALEAATCFWVTAIDR